MGTSGNGCDSATNDWLEFYEQKEELISVLEKKWERSRALEKCIHPNEMAIPEFNDVFRYYKHRADWSKWGLDVLWRRECTPEQLKAVEITLIAEGVIRKYGEWSGKLVLYV